MRINRIKVAFLVVGCAAIAFEVWYFRSAPNTVLRSSGPTAPKKKPDFALLPAGELAAFARLAGPSKADVESWDPTVGDMDDVEANLPQITELSNNDSDPNRHVDNPREYYRQYLAILMNGKRSIFVNALCSVDQNPNWRKQLVIVADGGKCFWHAMYDPSTQRFSDLTVNGPA